MPHFRTTQMAIRNTGLSVNSSMQEESNKGNIKEMTGTSKEYPDLSGYKCPQWYGAQRFPVVLGRYYSYEFQ